MPLRSFNFEGGGQISASVPTGSELSAVTLHFDLEPYAGEERSVLTKKTVLVQPKSDVEVLPPAPQNDCWTSLILCSTLLISLVLTPIVFRRR